MIQVSVINSKTNQSYGGIFTDSTAAQAWISQEEANGSWGKPQRILTANSQGQIIDIDGSVLEASDAASTQVITDSPAIIGVASSYVGIPNGCTTSVTITANNTGVAGNITLNSLNNTNLNTLIANWNTANPSNEITLTVGNGTQIPTQNIILSGGVDAVAAVTTTEYTFIDYTVTQTDITAQYNQQVDVQTALQNIATGNLIIANVAALNSSLISSGTMTETTFSALLADQNILNIERCLQNGSLTTAKSLIQSASLSTYYTNDQIATILALFP